MNKADNMILLNHQLLAENESLKLQVQVLSRQIQLYEKELTQHTRLSNVIELLQTENIQLKREILSLQEKIQQENDSQGKSIELFYASKMESLLKEQEEDKKLLKQEYQEKLFKLQQEKQQLFEQAVSMGIQIQTSKNLEQQTNKIIQITQRLEKLLSDCPSSENGNSKSTSARDVYDNLISQLNVQLKKGQKNTSDSSDQLFPIVKSPKSPSQLNQQFSIKKFLSLTRTVESPRNTAYMNTLTFNSINKKN